MFFHHMSLIVTWDDQGYGDDGANYDDYFSLPADLAYTGNTADDNFFTAYDKYVYCNTYVWIHSGVT